MERTATFMWYGPFVLHGKRGEPAEVRLKEIARFQAATRGLYLVVGAMRRALIRADRIVYVGRTGRNFYQRFCEHLDRATFGDRAKLARIEDNGIVSGLWLAVQDSYQNLCLEPAGEAPTPDPEERGGPADLEFYENLLIHVALRDQRNLSLRAADHANRTGFGAPAVSAVMINRFNTDMWEHKHRPKWRPTMIPDIIDCRVEADGRSLSQLIWTGTRGVVMHRRECGAGRLQAAPRSKPRRGLAPSL